ncbi:molybdopterin molybdotransferase [Lentzea xinjiangensis]|uniref:Molybdopterin molybdenumtransferase n=1 Tax=Lentzea xinjiangensis TaxID=402600 RepID=A0A1H9LYE9_9PSEU|nr:molybdopterin molybdotransferase MoeA [Lentzea xinjiangensis]SER16227.1 molybdopterin molybdotransferase [Lentzea xinjiangensis]
MTMPWTLARQTARDAVKPLDAVEVALPDAVGAVLASAVRALADQPACATSAMDGYAVSGPGPWTITGRVAAGDPVPGVALGPGEAFGVATGAPVPDGSDLVVPVEQSAVAGAVLSVDTGVPCRHTDCRRESCGRPPHRGKHLRRRGEDWSAGEELLHTGAVVSPAVLGLAAGAGHDTLLVHRRPRAAVVVTGDELLRSGPPRPGRVRDAIGPMLPSLLTGADLLGTTYLRDDPAALAAALTGGAADVLVTCGATSVGAADHLRHVLATLGADVLVSGVACRPGHPMLLAVLPGGRCVVGLPGNPFAAFAAVMTLLRPLLDTLGGHTARPPATAWLGDVGAHPRDTRLVPVTRSRGVAVPVGHDRPGSLRGAALAGALAVVPPGHRGGEVELLTCGSAS